MPLRHARGLPKRGQQLLGLLDVVLPDHARADADDADKLAIKHDRQRGNGLHEIKS